MSGLDKAQWESICADTVTKMIGQVERYTTPISRVLSDEEGEHLGTGSYIEFNNEKFLITNEHVAQHLATQSLTHKFFENENILRITNPAYANPAPIDVAISRIEQSSWNMFEHGSLVIPSSRFAKQHAPAQNELLFFAGYSGQRSRFSFGHLISRGTPYLTQECPFPNLVNEANPEFHFSLHYPPDLATSIDGSSHLPNPHGFSGSLVWDTKQVACFLAGQDWRPEMAEVTGILWGWPSSAACILATRAEHMGLNQLIEQSCSV